MCKITDRFSALIIGDMRNEFAAVWFFNQGWSPHVFQQACWTAMSEGKSGILNAPTGYGKTFAIWFGILSAYYNASTRPKKRTLHALWITPLKLFLRRFIALASPYVMIWSWIIGWSYGLETPPRRSGKSSAVHPQIRSSLHRKVFI